MKNLFASIALFAFLTIPFQGAYAWSYEGVQSLNPFTNFGRNGQCACQKVEKCKKPKLTKCEKLHGVKIKKAKVTGCAAPVEYIKVMPYAAPANCAGCQKTF